jgi:signal transduction histidine kinase
MKIERRLILSNGFTMALLVLIGLVGYQSLNLMLTKLRFVEIADDLNAGLLEMRLAEKNYFLYGDARALAEIDARLLDTQATIERARSQILPAIGAENLAALLVRVRAYADALQALRSGLVDAEHAGGVLRAKGQELREFSGRITGLERAAVNRIVTTLQKVLFAAFALVFVAAFVVTHVISQRILRSLRQIENVAHSISQGTFQRIAGPPGRDELGLVVAAVNTMSEELEKREEQLIQSKKLASLGVLTAGVTHELANPVNNISMIAQAFLELGERLPREKQLEMVGQIEQETGRIKSVITSLLDFSKPQGTKLMRADLNAIIRKTMGLVQNMLTVSNIHTELRLVEPLPAVCVDEHQVQQVLVNLIANAIQAMERSGRLTLESRPVDGGARVEFAVRDTGHGIAAEHLPHIFDPFFSTKGVEGTGLGLSVSYGIIKNLKGDIRVDSVVGAGTTFTVSLPSC